MEIHIQRNAVVRVVSWVNCWNFSSRSSHCFFFSPPTWPQKFPPFITRGPPLCHDRVLHGVRVSEHKRPRMTPRSHEEARPTGHWTPRRKFPWLHLPRNGKSQRPSKLPFCAPFTSLFLSLAFSPFPQDPRRGRGKEIGMEEERKRVFFCTSSGVGKVPNYITSFDLEEAGVSPWKKLRKALRFSAHPGL